MTLKKGFLCAFLVILCLSNEGLLAQDKTDTVKPIYKVGVFAPLYLDSVFTNNKFRYEKTIPKFIMPAIDFVQGAMIAFDTLSLSLNNVQVEAFIYDTRSFTEPLSSLIQNNKLDSLDLMIGAVKDVEYKELADYSLKKNVPFISATYPNDGGVQNNPNVTILNSTLKANCEGIFSFILLNHGTSNVYLCRKPGAQEDKIVNYFKNINEQEGKPLLNIQILNFDSTISTSLLKNKLDTNHLSIIIGASLDERFAKSISDACYSLSKKNYLVNLIGMPNWDGFKFFSKKMHTRIFHPLYNALL